MIIPLFDQTATSLRPDRLLAKPSRAGLSTMAEGHRNAARSVVDRPEHGGKITTCATRLLPRFAREEKGWSLLPCA
jgi:hypothetical protein